MVIEAGSNEYLPFVSTIFTCTTFTGVAEAGVVGVEVGAAVGGVVPPLVPLLPPLLPQAASSSILNRATVVMSI
jgi:hypothetical protein